MLTSKIHSRIAAISLLSLASAAPLWGQESGGEIESFNRSLGLEGIGTDLASVEHEIEHASPAPTSEIPKSESTKKAPAQKKPPRQSVESFANLTFRTNPAVTNTIRAYYVSHLTGTTVVNAPSYDSLIDRFDERFAKYGYSRNNIGDTVAGYMITTWEILHNADASNTPAGIRRVRAAVCQILEQRGKASQLTNDNKQKVSELLKCVTELGNEAVRRARQANNQAAIQQVQNQLGRPLLNLGVNLWRFRLTDRGFVNG